jgi:hypothetical protein
MSVLDAFVMLFGLLAVLSAAGAVLCLVAEFLERRPERPKTRWAQIDDELARRRALRAANADGPLRRPAREVRRDAFAEYQR